MDGLQPLVLPLAAVYQHFDAVPQVLLIAMPGVGLETPLPHRHAYAWCVYTIRHACSLHGHCRKVFINEPTLALSSANLPPLLTMESLLFRMISVAFSLLTVALASGVMFSEEIFNKPVILDHKTLLRFSWASLPRCWIRSQRLWLAWANRTAMDAQQVFSSSCWLMSAADSSLN